MATPTPTDTALEPEPEPKTCARAMREDMTAQDVEDGNNVVDSLDNEDIADALPAPRDAPGRLPLRRPATERRRAHTKAPRAAYPRWQVAALPSAAALRYHARAFWVRNARCGALEGVRFLLLGAFRFVTNP